MNPSCRLACRLPHQRTTGVVLAALALANASVAWGQMAPNAGAVLNQVEPRDTRPAPPAPANALPAMPKGAGASVAASGPTFTLRSVRLTGNDSVSSDDLLPLARDQIGKEVSLQDLNDLATRLTAEYRRRGFSLAQVVVPPQDVTSGNVTLTVIEGRVERVVVNLAAGTRLSEAAVRARLAAIETGKPLRQHELERAMLLLSDLPGVKVSSAVEPGNEPGSVILDVDVAPARPWDFVMNGDNYGSPSTGTARLGMLARLNSPFGIGDNLDLRLLGTQRMDALYGRIGYDAPFNAEGTRVGIGYAHLYYNVGQQFAALGAHGEADVVDLAVSHPLIRSRNQTLLLRGGIEYRNLVDKIGSVSLDTPKSLTEASSGVSYESRDGLFGGGFTSAAVSLIVGTLNIRSGDAKSLDQGPGGRDTQGTGVHATFFANRLNAVTDRVSVFVGVSGQWSDKNLDNSSRMLLGGPQAVRAYSASEGLVDEGFIATAECRFAITSVVTVLGFYDIGKGWYNARSVAGQGPNSITRSGVGAGAFWAAPAGFTVQGTLAWRTSSPDTTGEDRRPRLYVQVSKAF
jgi:hemolysin activation/secretion protein